MPLSKLVFKPGLNKDQTNYASEGGWYDIQWARFRSGFPEKMGGWTLKTLTDYVGTARTLFSWITTDGNILLAIGTNEKIYVNAGTQLYDITPIRETFTHSTTPSTDNCLTTTNLSTTITVTLASNNCTEGDWVTISGVVGTGVPQKINNIPITEINAEHKIFNVTANTFDIEVTTPANASGSNLGGTAITVAAQINIGNERVTAGYGWGAGPWSRGSWGSGATTPIYQPARLVFFDNWNNDLIFNVNNSYIYYWQYDSSFSYRGILLQDYEISGIPVAVAVPQQVSKIMFHPSGHLLALGCTNYDPLAPAPYVGSYDALLLRWSNLDAVIGPEPYNWAPETTNSAGYLRCISGSRIVTGFNTRQETVIFTDSALSSLQFLGTVEVFGLQEISHEITIIGPNSVASANNVVYWMGVNKFYSYSGRVDTLPCTLRQYVFEDINTTQGQLTIAGTNNQFNEIIWMYCSANSNEIDRYVVYNHSENIWYYGNITRTAWLDSSVSLYPFATNNGVVYNHEDGVDAQERAGTLPIESYIQSADVDIDDGDKFMLIRRMIPDINFTGSNTSTNPTPSVDITVGVRNFPGAVSDTTNAEGNSTTQEVITANAEINQYTNQIFIRARGRQLNFRIASDTLGTQWQLGMPRIDARPDGARG